MGIYSQPETYYIITKAGYAKNVSFDSETLQPNYSNMGSKLDGYSKVSCTKQSLARVASWHTNQAIVTLVGQPNPGKDDWNRCLC